MYFITYFSIFTLIVGLAFWIFRFSGYAPEPYRSRLCQGRAWKTTFPEKSKHEIREFLLIFTDAFAFRQNQKLQINPSDSILELYKAIYRTNFGGDMLELETFEIELERKYKINFRAIWSEELTFGRLYEYCSRNRLNQVFSTN
jgi:propanediol dehydratase small subunit